MNKFISFFRLIVYVLNLGSIGYLFANQLPLFAVLVALLMVIAFPAIKNDWININNHD